MKKKLIAPITYVVNLSGYVNHASFGEEGKKIINTHFLGLVNLTKFLFKKKLKKFVQIGSGLEYGSTKAPQNEKQYGLPSSPYALAKLASTRFLLMLYLGKRKAIQRKLER